MVHDISYRIWMFGYSRPLDGCKLKYNLKPGLRSHQFLCLCVSHPIVSQAIYRQFIAHHMTDTLTEAGLREIAQSAVQYSEAFIKTSAVYKPFWPEHYGHPV